MAVERIFNESDIDRLLQKNAASPYGRRNAALILGGVYWGLTPLEASQVEIDNVMAANGELYKVWRLPAHFSYNGEAREIHTEDHILPFFEKYLELRREREWGLSSLISYRSLAPDSKFFLNDSGEPYKLTPRKADSGGYQPRSMNEQLKRMIARSDLSGATPSSFRNSFIKGMYENGCGWTELKKITGIKQKRTLEKKVRPRKHELKKVLRSLYSHVKIPDEFE